MLHEVRSEYAQLLTVVFLLINGPGKWSVDAVLQRTWKTGGVSKRAYSRPLTNLPIAARS